MSLAVTELNATPLNKENKNEMVIYVSFANAVSNNKLRDMQKCKYETQRDEKLVTGKPQK